MDISTQLSINVKIGTTELVLTAEDAEILYTQLYEILGKGKDVPCPPYTPYTPYIPPPTAPLWPNIPEYVPTKPTKPQWPLDERPWCSTTEFRPGTMIRTDDPTT